MNTKPSTSYKTLLLAVVLSLGLTAVFWNFLNAQTDEISGCVAKGGILRIINFGTSVKEKCNKNETPLSWNSQGIPGPQGEQGPAGVDGKNGQDGTNGADGKDGTELHLFDGNVQDLGISGLRSGVGLRQALDLAM